MLQSQIRPTGEEAQDATRQRHGRMHAAGWHHSYDSGQKIVHYAVKDSAHDK
jgi:hypothetical protein